MATKKSKKKESIIYSKKTVKARYFIFRLLPMNVTLSCYRYLAVSCLDY